MLPTHVGAGVALAAGGGRVLRHPDGLSQRGLPGPGGGASRHHHQVGEEHSRSPAPFQGPLQLHRPRARLLQERERVGMRTPSLCRPRGGHQQNFGKVYFKVCSAFRRHTVPSSAKCSRTVFGYIWRANAALLSKMALVPRFVYAVHQLSLLHLER